MTCGVVAAQQADARGSHQASAKLTQQYFYAATRVTSSTHKKLLVTLSASKPASGPVRVTVGLTRGPESHAWEFTSSRKAFVLSGKQAGYVKASQSSTHGYAAIDLKFSKRKATKKTSCSSADYDTQTALNVTGTVRFNTKSGGSGAWGKLSVARKKKNPLSASSFDTYGSGVTCRPGRFTCSTSTGWNLYGSGSSAIYGGSDGSRGFVAASKLVKLGSYGTRSDSVYTVAPKPTKAGSGADTTYSVTTGKGQAHGSLTFHATAAPSNYGQRCYVKTKKTTETTSSYSAKVGSHGFAINEQIFGAFKIPANGSFSTTKIG